MASVDETGTTYAAGYGSVPTAEPPSYATARDAETGTMHTGDEYKETLVNVSLAVRMSFVRKVYSILAAQLGLTALVSAFCLYNSSVREFVQTHPAVLMVTAFGTIGLIFAVEIYRRSYPLNMILLGIFTLAESYTIGFICSLYESEIVLQAALLTFVVFIGLTLFTLQSKADFSGLGPFL
ncbi:Transmembrane BAX inhibitor motif-containing protein 4, partial [Cladochytrium tenue]